MPLNLNLLNDSHSNGPGTYSVMKMEKKINDFLFMRFQSIKDGHIKFSYFKSQTDTYTQNNNS